MYIIEENPHDTLETVVSRRRQHCIRDYEYSQEGIAIVDTEGILCYLNPAWKHLLGNRDAEAFRLGNNYLAVLNAIFSDECRTYVEAIAHGLHMVLDDERDYVVLEYPHDRAGQWHWFLVEISSYPIGDRRGALITQRDITHELQVRAVGCD